MVVEARSRNFNNYERFWREERENTPQWFADGSNAWQTSWEDFKGFCNQCWKVYDLGDVLIYVERVGEAANIHISVMRGAEIEMGRLEAIRDELFQTFPILFGWIGTHNRGLKRIAERLGFRLNGARMLYGQSHGKVLKWDCYSVHRKLIVKDSKMLLQS